MPERFQFLQQIVEWNPGQHMSLIGDTGSGKTTLVENILSWQEPYGREFAIVLRSKPDDVKWHGYHKVRRGAAAAMDNLKYRRLLVEPDYWSQLREFSAVLEKAYADHGSWTVFLDDLPNMQKMGPPLHSRNSSLLDQILTMGRSKANSVVTAMQLPVDATSYAIGESRITISFMLSPSHIKVLKEKTSDLMAATVLGLGEFEFAIYDRRTRAVWRGKLDLGSGQWLGDFVQSTEKVRAG